MLKLRALLMFFVVSCLAFAVDFAGADTWPRFRGPNGSGVVDAKTIPVKWTDKDILWKIELPGKGNSSPIIWNDRLFIQCASNDNKERMLFCLDVKDGATRWIKNEKGDKAKKPTGLHKMNSLASASPAVDAERVYAAFWDGAKQILKAYTHEGKELWNYDFGKFEAQHGAGASPICFGDKVYFNNDWDGHAELFCFDGKTGKVVWKDKRPHNTACYSSPLFRTLPDGKTPELVVVTTMAITGYDPDKGDKRWNWEWKFKTPVLLRTIASPLYDQGMLYAFSGDNPAGAKMVRHAIAVRLEKDSPALVWEDTTKDFPYISTPVVFGNHLYFVNDSGWIGCYDAKTGKRAWLEKLEANFSSSPIVIDGKIYVADEHGEVYVIATNPIKLDILARNSVDELVRATPAVADERLFVRGQKHLFCIGKK